MYKENFKSQLLSYLEDIFMHIIMEVIFPKSLLFGPVKWSTGIGLGSKYSTGIHGKQTLRQAIELVSGMPLNTASGIAAA